MTLDEAIEHARDVATRNRRAINFESEDSIDDDIKMNCLSCAEEHERLAEWLEEYKKLKELFTKTFIKDCNTCEQEIYEKAYTEGQDKGFSDGHFFGYNKAIDDFVEKYKYCDNRSIQCHKALNCADCIAEQLKAGE